MSPVSLAFIHVATKSRIARSSSVMAPLSNISFAREEVIAISSSNCERSTLALDEAQGPIRVDFALLGYVRSGSEADMCVHQPMSAFPPIATSIAFFGISGGHLTFDNERDLKGVHSAVLVSPIRGGANAVHRNYEDHFGGGRSRRSSYWHRFAARFLSRDQSAGS